MNSLTRNFIIAAGTFGIATASLAEIAIYPAVANNSESTVAIMPRLSIQPAGGIEASLVDHTVSTRTLPTIFEEQGRTRAMQRLLEDSVKRSHTVGHLAEEDFVNRNPAWRKTTSPNAPQNDVWTFFKGDLQGAQIKTHRSGNPAEYLRDMFNKDTKAEYFLVPDEHYPALEAKIRSEMTRAEANGNQRVVEAWRKQLGRAHKLGRTYQELEVAVLDRGTTLIARASAVRVGAGATIVTMAVDGAIILYRSADGQLTPTETVQEVIAAGSKATAVGGATAAAVVLGATPIGLTVIVVGTVTYIVVDYVVGEVEAAIQSSPLTQAQIEAVLPTGWRMDKP